MTLTGMFLGTFKSNDLWQSFDRWILKLGFNQSLHFMTVLFMCFGGKLHQCNHFNREKFLENLD